jgi:glutathione S-transferase
VALKVDRARRAAYAARMREVFDAAGRVLEKQPFLGGARASDADVCFAAIGAIAILVSPAEGYGGGACAWRMPDRGLPADMRAVFAELRASRAGAHILRMYREARQRKVQ